MDLSLITSALFPCAAGHVEGVPVAPDGAPANTGSPSGVDLGFDPAQFDAALAETLALVADIANQDGASPVPGKGQGHDPSALAFMAGRLPWLPVDMTVAPGADCTAALAGKASAGVALDPDLAETTDADDEEVSADIVVPTPVVLAPIVVPAKPSAPQTNDGAAPAAPTVSQAVPDRTQPATTAVPAPAAAAAPAPEAAAPDGAGEQPPVSPRREVPDGTSDPVLPAVAGHDAHPVEIAQDVQHAVTTDTAPPLDVPAAPATGASQQDLGKSPELLPATAARAISQAAVPTAPAATNDGASSQGQPRQFSEFMRLAVALSQVSPASGDSGHAAASPAFSVPAVGSQPAQATAALAVSAPAPTPAPEAAPAAENVGRLIQAMRANARGGAWEATVHLKPEHFGEVTIAMRVERNTVAAVVHAESAGVCQWLESQEQAVRSGMAEHGLSLDRFVVHRDGQQSRRDAQQQESRRRNPQRQPQHGQRFEILV